VATEESHSDSSRRHRHANCGVRGAGVVFNNDRTPNPFEIEERSFALTTQQAALTEPGLAVPERQEILLKPVPTAAIMAHITTSNDEEQP
jgi:hypothetical protein